MRQVCLALSYSLGRLLIGQSAYRSHTRASPTVLIPPPCHCSGGVERKELTETHGLLTSAEETKDGLIPISSKGTTRGGVRIVGKFNRLDRDSRVRV